MTAFLGQLQKLKRKTKKTKARSPGKWHDDDPSSVRGKTVWFHGEGRCGEGEGAVEGRGRGEGGGHGLLVHRDDSSRLTRRQNKNDLAEKQSNPYTEHDVNYNICWEWSFWQLLEQVVTTEANPLLFDGM